MEQTTVYSANGDKIQSIKQVNTIESLLKSYLDLLGEEVKLKNRTTKIKMEIKDIESALNRELKFNSEVGKMIKVGDRVFCCLKGEEAPIVIEMDEWS